MSEQAVMALITGLAVGFLLGARWTWRIVDRAVAEFAKERCPDTPSRRQRQSLMGDFRHTGPLRSGKPRSTSGDEPDYGAAYTWNRATRRGNATGGNVPAEVVAGLFIGVGLSTTNGKAKWR